MRGLRFELCFKGDRYELRAYQVGKDGLLEVTKIDLPKLAPDDLKRVVEDKIQEVTAHADKQPG